MPSIQRNESRVACLEFNFAQEPIILHYFRSGIKMDTLDGTEWDVAIVGTGVTESLLALYACSSLYNRDTS